MWECEDGNFSGSRCTGACELCGGGQVGGGGGGIGKTPTRKEKGGDMGKPTERKPGGVGV